MSLTSLNANADENELKIDYFKDITNKLYIDIKIANYTEESQGQNRPAEGSGRILIGLFGNKAPKAATHFLNACKSNSDIFPSYLNSQFTKINENGLIEIEKLRGLELISIAGSDQYEYHGKLLPELIPTFESSDFKHIRRGLLTKSQLSGGLEFGITTRSNSQLDQFYEVFGIVIEGYEVLDAIEAIQRYSYKTATG